MKQSKSLKNLKNLELSKEELKKIKGSTTGTTIYTYMDYTTCSCPTSDQGIHFNGCPGPQAYIDWDLAY